MAAFFKGCASARQQFIGNMYGIDDAGILVGYFSVCPDAPRYVFEKTSFKFVLKEKLHQEAYQKSDCKGVQIIGDSTTF